MTDRRPLSQLVCIASLVMGLALAGCAGIEAERQTRAVEAQLNQFPKDYRDGVIALMRTYLNDPTNVRGAFITEPALRTLDGLSRYASCLRYNARTSTGRYAGSKDSIVVFERGRPHRVIDEARERCRDAQWRPFPELERLAR